MTEGSNLESGPRIDAETASHVEAETPPQLDPAELRRQAENLRRSAPVALSAGGEYSAARKILILLTTLTLVAGSVFLLIDANSRQRILLKASDRWARLTPGPDEAAIFKLPPPPPRQIEPRVIFPSAPIILHGQGDGTIYQAGESPEEPVAKTFVPPPKTPEAGGAFNLLRAKSAAAGKLASGELPGWQFREWRPVQAQPPRFWIDLVAVRPPDSRETHFIWVVDIQQETVEALSQAARDLEAGKGSVGN